MKSKICISGIALLFLSIILYSCDTSKRAYKSPAYSKSSGDYNGFTGTSGKVSGEEVSGWETKNAQTADRKMIYDADITLIVKKTDTATAKVIKIARKYKGYVLNTGTNYTTIRVAADSMHYAIAEIEKIGHVKYKNLYAEDITEEYADLTVRLDNATKARARYLELLAKATTVEETLKVEKELERLATEIELLEGKINRLNHLTEFSTITVTIQKKVQPGPVGFVFKYVFKGIKYLFVWG
jgi:hypothetical protein